MAVRWGTSDEVDDRWSEQRDGYTEEPCEGTAAIRDGITCVYCVRELAFPAVWWSGPNGTLYLHPECAFGLSMALLFDYQTALRGRADWLVRATHIRRVNERLAEATFAIQAHQKTVEQLEQAVATERALRAQEEQERRAIEAALNERPLQPHVQPVRLDPLRSFTREHRKEIYRRADGHCQTCGNALAGDWEPDHIVPHARGGKTETINGQALCRPCNRRKKDKVLTVDGGDQ